MVQETSVPFPFPIISMNFPKSYKGTFEDDVPFLQVGDVSPVKLGSFAH